MKTEATYKGKYIEIDERVFRDQTSGGINWRTKKNHKEKVASRTPGKTKAHLKPVISNYLFRYCAKYSRATKHPQYSSIVNSNHWNRR